MTIKLGGRHNERLARASKLDKELGSSTTDVHDAVHIAEPTRNFDMLQPYIEEMAIEADPQGYCTKPKTKQQPTAAIELYAKKSTENIH